jgi:putative hemolysin
MEQAHLIYMLILLVVLLGFSAFFSGSETALMAISRLRLKHLAETRPRRAGIVEGILKKPEKLIGTILLGNNLVNVAMSAIATAIAISIWGDKGIVYVAAVLTLVILIFAEITPKVYAKYFNERISFITAPILEVVMYILNPVVAAVTYLSNKVLLLMGVDVSKIKRPLMTEEEIKTCIGLGFEEGAITTEEQSMLSRVFTLNDKTVGQVMVSREKMAVLDFNASVAELSRIILKTGYSRFPVKKGNDLEIVGFVHGKDILLFMDRDKSGSLNKIMRPPYFVPADKKIDAQLRSFQGRKLHQAVVLDKGGKVVGLITLEDILEELVGSIRDEHDELE